MLPYFAIASIDSSCTSAASCSPDLVSVSLNAAGWLYGSTTTLTAAFENTVRRIARSAERESHARWKGSANQQPETNEQRFHASGGHGRFSGWSFSDPE
jgi:hypothetical protein